ncbi:MAG: hypothetical protein ABH814_01230 [bacterium]
MVDCLTFYSTLQNPKGNIKKEEEKMEYLARKFEELVDRYENGALSEREADALHEAGVTCWTYRVQRAEGHVMMGRHVPNTNPMATPFEGVFVTEARAKEIWRNLHGNDGLITKGYSFSGEKPPRW